MAEEKPADAKAVTDGKPAAEETKKEEGKKEESKKEEAKNLRSER